MVVSSPLGDAKNRAITGGPTASGGAIEVPVRSQYESEGAGAVWAVGRGAECVERGQAALWPYLEHRTAAVPALDAIAIPPSCRRSEEVAARALDQSAATAG
jgi:hypothetical protein